MDVCGFSSCVERGIRGGVLCPGQRCTSDGYNTTLGRWTQQDTLDVPLDPVNANRYAYVGSDPINNFDPLGLYDLEAAAGTVGAFAGGVGAVGATVGCVVGLIGSGPGCVAGAGAGAAIGGVAGAAFGIGVAIGNSIKGVYG